MRRAKVRHEPPPLRRQCPNCRTRWIAAPDEYVVCVCGYESRSEVLSGLEVEHDRLLADLTREVSMPFGRKPLTLTDVRRHQRSRS